MILFVNSLVISRHYMDAMLDAKHVDKDLNEQLYSKMNYQKWLRAIEERIVLAKIIFLRKYCIDASDLQIKTVPENKNYIP